MFARICANENIRADDASEWCEMLSADKRAASMLAPVLDLVRKPALFRKIIAANLVAYGESDSVIPIFGK